MTPAFRRIFALVAFTVLSCTTLAAADEPAPAASPLAQPKTYPGLLGNFGNRSRAKLEKSGFSLNAHLVDEAAANLTGGIPLDGTAHARGTAL